MKKMISPKGVLWTILVLAVTLCAEAAAQWQPDVRLTNNATVSLTSGNNAWCIAASGDSVHVVWSERDWPTATFSNVFYKRSTDGGISWGTDFLLAVQDYPYEPSIAVSGSVVHVVWPKTPHPGLQRYITDARPMEEAAGERIFLLILLVCHFDHLFQYLVQL